MQKLILDTNVIVSALISSSIPSKILYEKAAPSQKPKEPFFANAPTRL
jgi:hypothetical protein